MRIIVMSDSHGNFSAVEKIVSLQPDADLYIHLGDGERDVDRLLLKHPEMAGHFIHVCGNCDYDSLSPIVFTAPVGNHKLYASHGHIQFVKFSLEKIREIAAANGCDIILFGHTHNRLISSENGVYMMNPGSCSYPHDGKRPSFGLIDVINSNITMNIADL